MLRSAIRFFVFDNNTKRLVIKNKEPCTKWIMLKVPSLVHFRRGSESLFYRLCVWLHRRARPLLCGAYKTAWRNTTLRSLWPTQRPCMTERYGLWTSPFGAALAVTNCMFSVIVCASGFVRWCVVSVCYVLSVWVGMCCQYDLVIVSTLAFLVGAEPDQYIVSHISPYHSSLLLLQNRKPFDNNSNTEG